MIYFHHSGCRSQSTRLRGQVDTTILDSASIMWKSWNESNNALQNRVSECTEARNRLQSHISRTHQEICDMEKQILSLKRAIRDKDAPLKV